jgi:glucose-1-phosphate cytidylyltransferase
MQVVILAGGFGTRLSEETDLIPKPMVRIGNIPILQHIMNYYSPIWSQGFCGAL